MAAVCLVQAFTVKDVDTTDDREGGFDTVVFEVFGHCSSQASFHD